MKNLFLARISLSLLFLISLACTGPVKEGVTSEKTVSTPEAEGISSRAILDFVAALDHEMPDQIHSLMLRRHGKIVAQGWWAPYKAEAPHMLYSLSKSFTSTAVGMAVEEGLISLDDQVISFFPEDAPEEPSANLKSMRIRDLLRMNTGHQWEPGREGEQGDSWARLFLAAEVQFKPGTHFLYNSMATYMLSAIIQKVSGTTLLEYLTPRLFEPLEINNPTWESDPNGISTGGWGLALTTEDISKFGQLYLQKGMWKGRQLLSESWVAEATKIQSSNGSNPDSDWDQGYGYQFWRCRHNLYRGDGAFGQFCIVMPGQDAVLAITSGTGNMQKVMDLAWEHLLPAMMEGDLPPDEEGFSLLGERLNNLTISQVKGEEESSDAAGISERRYDILTENSGIKSLSFDFDTSPHMINIYYENAKHSLKIGYQSWEMGTLENPLFISEEVAVSGAWVTPDSYQLRMVYFETPYVADYRFIFKGKQLECERELNVSRDPTKLETLRGISLD